MRALEEDQMDAEHRECLRRLGAVNPARMAKLDVIALQDFAGTELDIAEEALCHFVMGKLADGWDWAAEAHIEEPAVDACGHFRACLWSRYRMEKDVPPPNASIKRKRGGDKEECWHKRCKRQTERISL